MRFIFITFCLSIGIYLIPSEYPQTISALSQLLCISEDISAEDINIAQALKETPLAIGGKDYSLLKIVLHYAMNNWIIKKRVENLTKIYINGKVDDTFQVLHHPIKFFSFSFSNTVPERYTLPASLIWYEDELDQHCSSLGADEKNSKIIPPLYSQCGKGQLCIAYNAVTKTASLTLQTLKEYDQKEYNLLLTL